MNIGEDVLPENEGIIYVISDTINNKLYVGQTTKPLRVRWKEHVNHSKRNENMYPLAEAIKKYGEQNFYVNIIEIAIHKKLHEREKFWIDTLRTHTSQNGYNATEGGIDGDKVLVDTDEIIKTYQKLKSIRKTAIALNISRDIVANRIKRTGKEFYSMGEVKGIPFKVTCPNGETLHFVSKIELAKWIIENDIGNSKKIDTVRKRIGKISNYDGYIIESKK